MGKICWKFGNSLLCYIRNRTLSDWKQLRRNQNTTVFEDEEETSLAGVEISFWGAEWDEWESQFQIMEVHRSYVGNVDLVLWGTA